MKMRSIALAMAASVAMAGCADMNNAETGMIVGSVAGGILGNQVGKGTGKVLATAAGVVVGGIVGHAIGRSMDKQDRMLAQQAEYDALERGESGKPVAWRNPDSGHYGEVYPEPVYRRGSMDCRPYRHTVTIDGRRETMTGEACRNPDGTWSAVG